MRGVVATLLDDPAFQRGLEYWWDELGDTFLPVMRNGVAAHVLVPDFKYVYGAWQRSGAKGQLSTFLRRRVRGAQMLDPQLVPTVEFWRARLGVQLPAFLYNPVLAQLLVQLFNQRLELWYLRLNDLFVAFLGNAVATRLCDNGYHDALES